MLYTIIKIAKWGAVPVLLAGGPFTRSAGEYEFFLSAAVCAGAVIAACLALWKKEYLLAAGLTAVAIVFSPFLLVTKIFVLLTFAGIVTFLTLLAAFRPRAVTTENDFQA